MVLLDKTTGDRTSDFVVFSNNETLFILLFQNEP